MNCASTCTTGSARYSGGLTLLPSGGIVALHRAATKANPVKAGDAKLRGYRPCAAFARTMPVGPPNRRRGLHARGDHAACAGVCLYASGNIGRFWYVRLL